MHLIKRCVKPLVPVVIVAFLNLSMPVHPASAAMVGTDTAINMEKTQNERQRLNDFLSRDDARAQMQALGISADEAALRVAGLSSVEVASLTDKLDQMPAGGDGLGAVVGAFVLIFIILLFTDIAGLTHVYPFVTHKK